MWKIGGLTVYLIILSAHDIKSRRIPLWLLAGGGAIATGGAVLSVFGGDISLLSCLASLAPGFVLLVAAGASGKVGYGDGMVLMATGLTVGAMTCLYVFFLSLFLTAAVSGLLLLFRRAERTTMVPYIPFMTAALLIVLYAEKTTVGG